MRIATWNVNSLKARLEKVTWWLERARPDVLLMQETKLADAEAPVAVFREAGYELAHHGEGQWNGVAIASRATTAASRTTTRRASRVQIRPSPASRAATRWAESARPLGPCLKASAADLVRRPPRIAAAYDRGRPLHAHD